MKFELNPKIRFAIYVIFGLGQFVAAYLATKNHIGEAELKLFSQISGFGFGLAAINVKEK